MSFQPVSLDVLGMPITYESIAIAVVTAGLLYVPVRAATPAGFYLVKRFFAMMTGTKGPRIPARTAANRKAGGNPQGPPGTGGGTSPGGVGGGGSGLGGGSAGGGGLGGTGVSR